MGYGPRLDPGSLINARLTGYALASPRFCLLGEALHEGGNVPIRLAYTGDPTKIHNRFAVVRIADTSASEESPLQGHFLATRASPHFNPTFSDEIVLIASWPAPMQVEHRARGYDIPLLGDILARYDVGEVSRALYTGQAGDFFVDGRGMVKVRDNLDASMRKFLNRLGREDPPSSARLVVTPDSIEGLVASLQRLSMRFLVLDPPEYSRT